MKPLYIYSGSPYHISKVDFYICYILFYSFVIANSKNIYYYYVPNILTMPYYFGIAKTKWLVKPSLFSSASILYACSLIILHIFFTWISIQSLSSSQLARTTLLSFILSLRFIPVKFMLISVFVANRNPVLLS